MSGIELGWEAAQAILIALIYIRQRNLRKGIVKLTDNVVTLAYTVRLVNEGVKGLSDIIDSLGRRFGWLRQGKR